MIDGTALFAENGVVANLTYRIECGPDWRTQSACVRGWIGQRSVDVTITRCDAGWDVTGVPVAADSIERVAGLNDVDLGFTPATNTNAIRRLGLAVGEEGETTALWLDVDNWIVRPLRQIYRRLGRDRYEYISPENDYAAVLLVNGASLVTEYPSLWVEEPPGG